METLTRSMSLAHKRKTVTVECPEWDCKVILRELSHGQMRELNPDPVLQLSLMIVDDEGNRVYKSDDDIAELREMSWLLLRRLIEAAADLNGISQAAVDETTKKSQADPNLTSVSA